MSKIALAFIVASFLSFAPSASDAEPSLSETLAWMDNTYNSHLSEGGAFGHGVEESYSDGKLFRRGTETFTYDGCQITLNKQEDPDSPLYSDVYSSRVYIFNLRDIDPSSVKILPLDSQHSGLYCAIDPAHMVCDSAKIEFQTRNQTPLIDEESHTIFSKLQGSDHESKNKTKTFVAVFYVDERAYADRFAKALRHAIELCGGNPSAF
jgi:hypothetical protein